MKAIIDAIYQAKRNQPISREALEQLQENLHSFEDFQWASLATFLKHGRPHRNIGEAQLVRMIMGAYPSVEDFLETRAQASQQATYQLMERLEKKQPLGLELINHFVQNAAAPNPPHVELAITLALIYVYGLQDQDLTTLTRLMTSTGRVYDYRKIPKLNGRKIIRRYPTGALSEKVALLMPALISSFRGIYPIASPFLIAKSLGFTGGTWDKLKAVPGFQFPLMGEQAIDTMDNCGVAMTVTEGDYNPADRFLYPFRSITGTIESLPLMVSSIVSKQLAIPADFLLLDVRYGPGAFVKTREEGEQFAQAMLAILKQNGTNADAFLTDTQQPNGMAIGNYFEVLEALQIMNPMGNYLPRLHKGAMREQRDLVVNMFAHMVHHTFGHEVETVREKAIRHFEEGLVFASFQEMLSAHGVDGDTMVSINKGRGFHPAELIEQNVLATQEGNLKSIDQEALGNYVNFTLKGGYTDVAGGEASQVYAGVLLHKRLGDAVKVGDVLCTVYAPEKEDLAPLYSAFTMGDKSVLFR